MNLFVGLGGAEEDQYLNCFEESDRKNIKQIDMKAKFILELVVL